MGNSQNVRWVIRDKEEDKVVKEAEEKETIARHKNFAEAEETDKKNRDKYLTEYYEAEPTNDEYNDDGYNKNGYKNRPKLSLDHVQFIGDAFYHRLLEKKKTTRFDDMLQQQGSFLNKIEVQFVLDHLAWRFNITPISTLVEHSDFTEDDRKYLISRIMKKLEGV